MGVSLNVDLRDTPTGELNNQLNPRRARSPHDYAGVAKRGRTHQPQNNGQVQVMADLESQPIT